MADEVLVANPVTPAEEDFNSVAMISQRALWMLSHDFAVVLSDPTIKIEPPAGMTLEKLTEALVTKAMMAAMRQKPEEWAGGTVVLRDTKMSVGLDALGLGQQH